MALKPVILIGAGVIGLTTAYTILSRYPGTKVLVLAAEEPPGAAVRGRRRAQAPSADGRALRARAREGRGYGHR